MNAPFGRHWCRAIAGPRRETKGRGRVDFGKNIYKGNPNKNEWTQKNQKLRMCLQFYIATPFKMKTSKIEKSASTLYGKSL